MGGMRRAGAPIAMLAALAAAAALSAEAAPAAPAAPNRAVVMVATPRLPTGEGATARTHWHELRAQSRRVLTRVADRDGLQVETAIPEIGMLSVAPGPGGSRALKENLDQDPRAETER